MTNFLGGGAKPKPRIMPEAGVADFDRALQVLEAARADKKEKTYLTQCRDAKAASNLAHEEAGVAGHNAAEREEAAQKAEASASAFRQKLADETSRTTQDLIAREQAVHEREQAADAREAADQMRRKELESLEAKVAFREGMVEKYFKKGAKK